MKICLLFCNLFLCLMYCSQFYGASNFFSAYKNRNLWAGNLCRGKFNNILMFIIKLLLTNFIEKKTHRHIAKSTGMNAIILLFLRERTNGKQFGCGHTPKFLLGRRPRLKDKPLGQNVPKLGRCFSQCRPPFSAQWQAIISIICPVWKTGGIIRNRRVFR